jgi:permuted papain-like amidase YaeF/Yiix C92 family enzyme
MRIWTQILLALTCLLGAVPGALAGDLPPLKNGDIVFQESSGSARDAIMLASASPYSHVGIVEIDASGRPMVLEAAKRVRSVPFEDWMRRGAGRRITIKRVKGLHDEAAKQAIERARHYMGRPYDIFFYETRDQIYCSELVYAAFKEGANISVGREEKVSDLNIDTAAAQRLIKKRWKAHPLCRTTSSFKSCYPLILNQLLVTPASIARDPQMELIYTSFGRDAE